MPQLKNSTVPGVPEKFFAVMRREYAADKTGPLIKRAVVGNHRIGAATAGNLHLQADEFDNVMQAGASGDPIVDSHRNAVGIITERGVTSADQPDATRVIVPSGVTVGISLHAIDVLRRRRSGA